MWRNLSATSATMCKHKAIARLFNLRPGMRILHLGAACGHHAHLLMRTLGVRAVGLELIAENAMWARERFAGEVPMCIGDAAHASAFLPNSSFDAVISNAVLRELPIGRQCELVRSSVALLKPGGCAWFGWLREGKVEVKGKLFVNHFPRAHWELQGCLRRTSAYQPQGFIFSTFVETDFFGVVEYPDNVGRDAYSLILCKDGRAGLGGA